MVRQDVCPTSNYAFGIAPTPADHPVRSLLDAGVACTASGFLRDASGRFTAINRPGSAVTAAFDINNRGQIVGVTANPEDKAGAHRRVSETGSQRGPQCPHGPL